MVTYRLFISAFIFLSFCLLSPVSFADKTSADIFANAKDGVVQIRVIRRGTGEKISIGSGFVVFSANRVVSNYHVVADYIAKPKEYRLQYVTSSGVTGDMALLDFDVVHDLSLLQASADIYPPFDLAQTPRNGAPLFSMGNPHDLGLTLTVGTSNGVLPRSDDGRILFSGSLNPGMSGGPTFNANREVVGVNVATSGNDLSFIIPAHYLEAFEDITESFFDEELIAAREQIVQQIDDYQAQLWAGFLKDSAWPTTSLDKFHVPAAISKVIRCWDNSKSSKQDDHYRKLASECENENSIYLSDDVMTNQIMYEYVWLQSIDLSPSQFYSLYQNQFNASNSLGYRGMKKDQVTGFSCDTHFVEIAQQAFKVALCRRDYKKFAGLSDLVMMAASVGDPSSGLLVKLSVMGAGYDRALTFMKRFLEHVTWQP